MARDRSLKIWVDGITAARLTVRAEAAGTSVSEYVGNLIVRDSAEGGRADALAGELLEMHFFSAIVLRALLARSVGEADADKLIERARTKAHEQAQAALAELSASKPDLS
jgi:hypothetical protein